MTLLDVCFARCLRKGLACRSWRLEAGGGDGLLSAARLPRGWGCPVQRLLSAALCRCLQDAGGPAEGRGLLPQPDAADEDPVPGVLCQPPVRGQRPHGAQVCLVDFFPGGGGGAVSWGSLRAAHFCQMLLETWCRHRVLFKNGKFNYPPSECLGRTDVRL